MQFGEDVIVGLFGNEAAEDEDPNRLHQYYFKGDSYSQITANQPLRVLVGHKGIGKSALFKVALAEAYERSRMSLLIQPNDLEKIGFGNVDFLSRVRDWTHGLCRIVIRKLFYTLGIRGESLNDKIQKLNSYGNHISDFMEETFREMKSAGECLSEKENAFIEDFLKTKTLLVYIDDLDRGWEGKQEDITRLSALLNSVRDISRENRGICFKVSLRADVYYLVRTSDESTDKIEGSVIWLAWTNHEILVQLIKRIETYFGRCVDESRLLRTSQYQLAQDYLALIMETRFTGLGKWHNAPIHRVLMSLIRKRPRDLVKLCTLAARQAYRNNSETIRTAHFSAVFDSYSQGRIQDTINEYKSELPNIAELLMNMKPNSQESKNGSGYVYTTDVLIKKIDNIQESHRFRFVGSNKPVSSKDLAAFLYKINFLTARKQDGNARIERKYFEESRYLFPIFADFGFDWEIHPAYRWALQPDNISSIFKTLDLSIDQSD